jgi:teichuronic acid biosynthesis glycosyltransferase TuaC
MMDEMKILFVCGGNNPDFGIAPFIASQAESLRRSGVTVDIFTIRGHGIVGYLRHLRPLRSKIAAGSYDLVHAHYTFCGWIARLATCRVPVVVSYMGSDFAGMFRKDGRRKPKSILMMAQGMLLNLFVKHIIVKGAAQMRMLPLKRRARVIPNGVDFDRFCPMPMEEARGILGLDGGMQFALFLGNPADPRKNFSLAEEACRIAGTSTPLELQAPWPAPPQQIPLYLNAANILVFTSWFEGSSNLLKEALACNCPAVATPVGDAPELIPGVDQADIIPFNPESAAEKIVQILRNKRRSNGRNHIAHLREEVVADQLIRLYRNATGNPESHESR